MNLDLVFQVCNLGVLPAWALLVLAPRWEWTQRVVHAVWIPALLGVIYIVFAVQALGAEGDFASLGGVMALLSQPAGALIGWIHFLAFDLFLGAWESRDAQRRGIPHWQLVPCLVLTLMMGPSGLVLYFVVRTVHGAGASLAEAAPQQAA